MWPTAWSSTETELRDGRRVLISPIAPHDKNELLAYLERLSARSRYLRFHAVRATLDAAALAYLTEVDHADHMAWVATSHDPGSPIVGVARYVRRAASPDTAEFAVSVADDHQGAGLGRTLMEFLAVAAEQNRIARFESTVLAENVAAVALFCGLGGHVGPAVAGTRVVTIPVPLAVSGAKRRAA